ncbi:hypothetical protein BDZ97DRAFT_1792624 [Flammula alnicola]|nr:hypothetical protein BDZ97DRAFT_1792624 [Flammula alnicola]
MSDVFEVLCELDSKNIIHGAITGTPDNLLFVAYQQSDPIKEVAFRVSWPQACNM